MKRFLAIAAIAAGLVVFTGTSNVSAADYFHGGHSGYGGGHHGGYQHGGYAHAPAQSYGNYGYQSHYGGQSYGYGQTYQSRYQSHYAPSYRTQRYGQQGGLHLDVGRFHVLGVGGHHH